MIQSVSQRSAHSELVSWLEAEKGLTYHSVAVDTTERLANSEFTSREDTDRNQVGDMGV